MVGVYGLISRRGEFGARAFQRFGPLLDLELELTL
jgi:hypothetical protein